MKESRKLPKKQKTRSGFEDTVLRQLKRQGVQYAYEPKKLLYRLSKYYIPDIELPNKILVECKGEFNKEDRDKMLAVRETNPGLDIRMLFQTDGYLNKLSKSARNKRLDIRTDFGKITREQIEELNKNRVTYSKWCEKHGFKYAIGKIPKEWIDE